MHKDNTSIYNYKYVLTYRRRQLDLHVVNYDAYLNILLTSIQLQYGRWNQEASKRACKDLS